MNIQGLPEGQSYQIRQVQAENYKDLQESLEDNDQVDIVVESEGATYVISGEKIDINELGQAIPELSLEQLQQYDRNQDGHLEEAELQLNWKEAGKRIRTRDREHVTNAARRFAFYGDYLAASVATVGGLTISLVSTPFRQLFLTGDYKTPDWDNKGTIKTLR